MTWSVVFCGQINLRSQVVALTGVLCNGGGEGVSLGVCLLYYIRALHWTRKQTFSHRTDVTVPVSGFTSKTVHQIHRAVLFHSSRAGQPLDRLSGCIYRVQRRNTSTVAHMMKICLRQCIPSTTNPATYPSRTPPTPVFFHKLEVFAGLLSLSPPLAAALVCPLCCLRLPISDPTVLVLRLCATISTPSMRFLVPPSYTARARPPSRDLPHRRPFVSARTDSGGSGGGSRGRC